MGEEGGRGLAPLQPHQGVAPCKRRATPTAGIDPWEVVSGGVSGPSPKFSCFHMKSDIQDVAMKIAELRPR